MFVAINAGNTWADVTTGLDTTITVLASKTMAIYCLTAAVLLVGKIAEVIFE